MIYRYDELKQYIQEDINYIDKNMDAKGIYVELKIKLNRIDSEVLQQELDEEYESFLDDIEFIEGIKNNTLKKHNKGFFLFTILPQYEIYFISLFLL